MRKRRKFEVGDVVPLKLSQADQEVLIPYLNEQYDKGTNISGLIRQALFEFIERKTRPVPPQDPQQWIAWTTEVLTRAARGEEAFPPLTVEERTTVRALRNTVDEHREVIDMIGSDLEEFS